MAGHSKFANIKHRKNAQDAKRSQLFTKLLRDVTVAARENPDYSTNPRLRLARDRALAANVKKENIEKAIKKVTDPSASHMESIRYEGYGPSGVPTIIDVFTDSRNRTASDIRYIFNRQGGSLGAVGSVAWMFELKGLITLAGTDWSESELLELALEVDAEDTIFSETGHFLSKLIVPTEVLNASVEGLQEKGITVAHASSLYLPKERTLITQMDSLARVRTYLETLEALPEVEAVYTSASWQLDT